MLTCGPQVTRSLEVFPAPNRVPVARRIHSLAAVVCRRPEVLCPEKLLARLVNEHRVVCDRATVIVQVMRTLGVRVVGATLSRQIPFVINDKMILIEMLVLSEIWTGVELNPGGIRTKAIAHNQMTDAAKEITARNFCARADRQDFVALRLDRPTETALSRRATSVARASHSCAETMRHTDP